jgi:hypothetical protein
MLRNRSMATVIISALGLVFGTQAAQAWDGNQAVIPTAIDVSADGSFGFRVWGPICVGANPNQNFGYLLSTDPNYETYVAVILMAKTLGQTVTFYTSSDGTGHCHIGYISMT